MTSPPPGDGAPRNRAFPPRRPATPAEPDKRGRLSILRSVFDPNLWRGALAIMVVFAALLWVVEVFDVVNHHAFDAHGLRPRSLEGLQGVVTMPFLHADVGHLLANTAPVIIVGWLALVGGLKDFLIASGIIVVGGGLLTWAVAPSGLIVGASALVFGWLGYLVARAIFVRRVLWIVAAVFAIFFFGSLFSGLLPNEGQARVSWQAHLCGFLAGLLAAYLLHPGKKSGRKRGRLRRPRKADGTPGPAIP